MEKQQLKRLSIAISAIMLLSVFTFLTQPRQEALALQLTSVPFGRQNPSYSTPFVYNNWNALLVSSNQSLLAVNASNNVILYNISLSSSIGGNHKAISGVDCQGTGQIQKSPSINKGSTTYCAITVSGGTSGSDKVFLFDATNGIQPSNIGAGASYTINYLQKCTIDQIPTVSGVVYCIYGDFGGTNNVYFDSWQLNYTVVNNVLTTPQVGKPFIAGAHFNTGFSSVNVQQPVDQFQYNLIGAGGYYTKEIGFTLNSGTTFVLFNAGTQSTICQVNLGVQGYEVRFATDPNGVNKWYVSTDNSIKVITDSTCAITNTLTLSSYDSTASHIRGIAIGTIRKEIYLYDDLGNLISMNQSGFAKVGVFPVAGDSATTWHRDILNTPDNLLITNAGQTDIGISVSSGTKYYIQYWGSAGAGGGSGGSNNSVTTCIDVGVAGGTLQKTCITCPGALGTPQAVSAQCPNGYPNFGAGKSGLPPQFNGGINGTQFLNAYGCTTGWFSCSNQDVTSNGIGFWFLIILIISSTMLLLWATYKTGHEVKDVTFAIILVAILESGALWQMKIVTPLPFYVGILGLIGMAGIKIYGKISSGGGSE